MKSIRITKRHLRFILPTEFEAVYSHRAHRQIEGHTVTLYSSDAHPGKGSTIGFWCEGHFYTENQRLAKVITTVAGV